MKAKLKVVINKVDNNNYTLRIYGDGVNEVYTNLNIDGVNYMSGMIISSYCLSLK